MEGRTSPTQDGKAKLSMDLAVATTEHKPSSSPSVRALRLYIHEARRVSGPLPAISSLLLLSSRPGRYTRGSTGRGARKALPSGRLVCAVLSTKVVNLRRFLRSATGMALSPTRCTDCCHQELSPLNQGPRNYHQSDPTVLHPLRRKRKKLPQRTAYSAPRCSRSPLRMRWWRPMGELAV